MLKRSVEELNQALLEVKQQNRQVDKAESKAGQATASPVDTGAAEQAADAKKKELEIAAAHPKILKQPETVIQLHELADSSVNFICRHWVHTADYWDVYWDITRVVKQRFDAAGISIPFPQRDVHIHNLEPMAVQPVAAQRVEIADKGQGSGADQRGMEDSEDDADDTDS